MRPELHDARLHLVDDTPDESLAEATPDDRRRRQIGILLFDGVEGLDAVGPWEVLSTWTQQHPEDGWDACCYPPTAGPWARQNPGARRAPLIARTPDLDVLVHPGGPGTIAMLHDRSHLDWVRRQRTTVP